MEMNIFSGSDPPHYTMYHCHTEYSLLDSCTNYKDYINLAVENGMTALSISEHGKPLNWTEKCYACKNAGIKYMHSVEIYLTENLEPKVRDNYHTVLIAKNMDGVRELNSLVSKSCEPDHFYYTNRISFDEFLNTSENIISTSACLASPLNKLDESNPYYDKLARKYTFLEIQPHCCDDQVAFNKRLYELSNRTGVPLIAGTDTHSSSKYKSECRAVLLDAKHKSYGDEDAFDLTFKTYEELVAMFEKQNALPKEVYMVAIENTNRLAEMTDDIMLDTTIKYPILYGSRDADDAKLVETIKVKFREKVNNGVIPKEQIDAFRAAMTEELRVFRKLNMTGFILSMSELVCWCKDNGMAIGTARGSVGGSRIAYVTDIIDLNPETWHTVFSRFANEDREEIGDIDIDCVESDRPKIFQYIVSRFGSDKTARVASFGTIQAKGVIDDVGRHLAQKWNKDNPDKQAENPWSLPNIARIKSEFDANEEKTKEKYPELFYYFDGLFGTKISQSVHPAGMIISPITLPDNFGVFAKDDDICLMLDMDNVHDYTGLAKYDFLLLKTVKVIDDTCKYIGVPYPKTHEIDWYDRDVWESMTRSAFALFQFEGNFAADSLKKFKPKNLFDMALVNAAIRPSGASYREDLFARKQHKNPSEIIDELLKDNLGYLVYQCDTIKFLQQICGLSGSEADNVRRAIGRKQHDRLAKALPSILDGYCSKSPLPRNEAEEEAKEFLQIIEDSASYQFGYNHALAYCMMGYYCAYYRYYYPLEFITSFLNNAANDEDIRNGTVYASTVGIKVTMPKWGLSKGEYFYDKSKNIIAKGLTSIKYMSAAVAEELYKIAHSIEYKHFVDVLKALEKSSINSRQVDILIKIDFFSQFGNQRELLYMYDLYTNMFKRGCAKQIKKDKIEDTPLEPIVKKYAIGTTKSGQISKSYTILDIDSILVETEEAILASGMSDLSDIEKVRNFDEIMGYAGYVSGKESDRSKLYVSDVFPVKRRKDGQVFAHCVKTKSIGSGIESSFTVIEKLFDDNPVEKGDVIICTGWHKDRGYFIMDGYKKMEE